MQLHNKDCMVVLKDIPDESIDLIATDPPYKVTSGIACVESGRDFIGCEIDAHYFEIAKSRIETAQSGTTYTKASFFDVLD